MRIVDILTEVNSDYATREIGEGCRGTTFFCFPLVNERPHPASRSLPVLPSAISLHLKYFIWKLNVARDTCTWWKHIPFSRTSFCCRIAFFCWIYTHKSNRKACQCAIISGDYKLNKNVVFYPVFTVSIFRITESILRSWNVNNRIMS